MKDRQNDGRKGVIFRGDVLQNIFLYTSQEEFFAVKSSSHLSLKQTTHGKPIKDIVEPVGEAI